MSGDIQNFAERNAGLERNYWLPNLFEQDPQPRIVLDHSGAVVCLNMKARAESASGAFRVDNHGFMQFGTPECTKRFQACAQSMLHDHNVLRRIVLRSLNGEWLSASLFAPWPQEKEVLLVTLHCCHRLSQYELEALTAPFHLSRSETTVMTLLMQGHSSKEVSRVLGISPHTVRAHTRAVYVKLGVNDRYSALTLAYRLLS